MGFPKLIKIRQRFDDRKIENIPAKIREELQRINLAQRIKPGAKVAISAGSRGIANYVEILAAVVKEVRALGANPFLVPAMGSHGGATAEGQVEVLKELGVTEKTVKAPIFSSMKVVNLGNTKEGVPVYFDKYSYHSEAIVVINRIKKHPSFDSNIESGLMKMMTIGLGKHKQALTIHSYGLYGLQKILPEVARIMLKKAPIVCGIGIVENAYDHTYKIVAMSPEEIEGLEKRLLKVAKRQMPTLPFDNIDLLIVEEMGKNISGSGMDATVIGRRRVWGQWDLPKPKIKIIVVLDLTQESAGNAIGIGRADFVTRKLVDKIDFKKTYTNVITAMGSEGAKIPITLETDREAISTALSYIAPTIKPEEARMVRIKNTLELTQMYISPSLLEEAREKDRIEILGRPEEMKFDTKGNLLK